jgi:uncharacterized membrane protein
MLGIVFLPILTFIRLGRISRELEALRNRVDSLERRPTFAADAATVGRPAASAADAATVGRPAASAADAATVGRPTASAADAAAVGASASARDDNQRELRRDLAEAAAGREGGPSEDLEERIGGRGLLYTGVLVLLLGVSFFLKYAFDNAWINETARVGIGLLAGIALVGGGLRLAGSGLNPFGHALIGTGFAVLYLTIYAALNFYELIGRGTAFAAMIVVTVIAAAVADRQRSQPLAFIAIAAGFLTPALVGGDQNAQLTLFSYDTILVFATMLLSLRHQWWGLNAVSYIATFLTVLAWMDRYYTDDQWLRTWLFLSLFCVSFLIILRATRISRTWTALAVRALLWTAPFFYHLAAIVLTAEHPPAIHVYLIAATVAGLWLTVDPHRPVPRVVLLLAVFIPLFGDLTLPDGRSWLVANIITIAAVALLHLMALADRVLRQDEALIGTDLLLFHLTGLGLFSLLYETLQPAFPEFRGALAAIIAAGAVILGRGLRPRDELAWQNALALAFTLIAIGIAVQFDGAAVVIGWAAEGAAATWFGVRAGRRAFQFGGVILWILATLELFESFSQTPAAFTLFLNARTLATAFVLACGYVMAWRLAAAPTSEASRMRSALHVIASALTIAWITSEIQSYWEVRADTAQGHLYEQMLLSLAWGIYGAVLIVVGMLRRFALLRFIGIAVIAITALKVFFYDLWELGGIYRVVGFLTFGVLLVLVSYLYQRRRAESTSQSPPPQSPPQSPPPPSPQSPSEPPSPL